MRSKFWQLEKLGQVQLSKHFQMRQFLYSEIAAVSGILNMPDDPDMAIENGKKLCELILEPLVDQFGPLIIRSGFRSAKLNAYGSQHGLKCAKNEKNYAYHIWDHLDANGDRGAAACIVIPAFNADETKLSTWQDIAWWIDENLPYHRLTFFKTNNAFNIGWHENPKQEIYSWKPDRHWLKRG